MTTYVSPPDKEFGKRVRRYNNFPTGFHNPRKQRFPSPVGLERIVTLEPAASRASIACRFPLKPACMRGVHPFSRHIDSKSASTLSPADFSLTKGDGREKRRRAVERRREANRGEITRQEKMGREGGKERGREEE